MEVRFEEGHRKWRFWDEKWWENENWVMEEERNLVLEVGERKRSTNGAGRVGNEMVIGGREILEK